MLSYKSLEEISRSKLLLFKKSTLIKKNITYKDFFNIIETNTYHLSVNYGKLKKEVVFLKIARGLDFYVYLLSCLFLGSKVIIIDTNIDNKNLKNLKKKFQPKIIIDQSFKVNTKTKESFKIYEMFSNLKNSKIILFTSGTTGEPKAISLNTIKFFENAIQFGKIIPIKKSDIILNNWPHYYTASVFNMFLCAVLNKASIVLEDQISSSNYFQYWKIIKKNKINIAYLTPTMSIALINYKRFQNKIKYNLKKLKIISTGAYLYPYLEKKFFDEFKVNLLDCFGATEIGASVTILDKKKKFKISKGVKFIIRNNKLGFLSKYMFEGYLINKNKLNKYKNKIYFTGDIAEKNKNSFNIIGRENEIIKKGGSQVSLIKIENQIIKHENVVDVICKPKKSKFWVEDFDAFVIFKNFDNSSVSKLIKFLSQNLNSVEMPDKIIEVSEIKKTNIGKKIRKKLKF
tara:strand:+ start:444 stop:1817 length:1374 start_codon:yes stop_codon:yes gene_type:complete